MILGRLKQMLTTLDNFDIICIKQFHQESILMTKAIEDICDLFNGRASSLIGEQKYIWSLRDEV